MIEKTGLCVNMKHLFKQDNDYSNHIIVKQYIDKELKYYESRTNKKCAKERFRLVRRTKVDTRLLNDPIQIENSSNSFTVCKD